VGYRLCVGILIAAAAPTAFAEPLPTRDQNPFVTAFGVPQALPSRLPADDEWHFDAAFNWSNSALSQASARENLFADLETRELRLGVTRTIAPQWALRAELPVRYIGAGTLDSFIDSWHDFFGLPKGIRPDIAHNQFRLRYVRDGRIELDLREPSTHIGDASFALGYRWLADERNDATLWLTAKAPTGSADDLSGSGAWDAGIAISAAQRASPRWSFYEQASATWLGNGDTLPAQQRSLAWNALIGAGFTVGRHVEFKAQFEEQSATYRSNLAFLGDALVFSLGGAIHFNSGWMLDLGVSEDVQVDASPDVTFVFGFKRATK
jgi:hypothetical protein